MSEEITPTGEHNVEAAAPVDSAVSEPTSEQPSGSTDGQSVPLTALQSEREQRQNLQEELKMIKDHLALMETQRQPSTAPPPKDDFDGMDDGDVLTLGDFKKLLSSREKQYQMSIEELRMTQKYPDYQQVLQQYLPEVLKTNPALRKSLENNPDYELAYHLAKSSDGYKTATQKEKKNMDAQRIVENAGQAGSLSSMGASTPVSQAKRYKDMSDKEFRQLMNNNLGVV